MSSIVSASGVSKSYGSDQVLRDVSFEVNSGAIVGLIGPNGAGKTTLLKSVLGLTGFDGDLTVLGRDPRAGRHAIMEDVCFVADVGVLPRWLKVSQAISYMEGVHPRFSRERAERFLAGTQVRPDHKVRQLSKGMVTQLHLALVMAVDAQLLVLDEPTLGLDILYRKTFYERLIEDYFDHETSIIVSTHQVEEVESLLTDLLFIRKGEIVLEADMESLAEHYHEVDVPGENRELALARAPLAERRSLGGSRMIFMGSEAELSQLGDVRSPSVADLFVAIMAEEAAEELS